MPEVLPFLGGTRVVDLTDASGALVARVLRLLGADVITADASAVDPGVLADADIVLSSRIRSPEERSRAPRAAWVEITPFGRGPRAGWRGSDLTAAAASGHMWVMGDADRPPVRSTAPATYAHAGGEGAFAALTALACGHRGFVDVSLQEVMATSSLMHPASFPVDGERGHRNGAFTPIGTREVWQCADGWVVFGIRGGPARVATWRALARELEGAGLLTDAWSARDWAAFNHMHCTPEELRAIEEPLAEFFRRHTSAELDRIALANNVMLAPCDDPARIYAREQFRVRELFEADGAPRTFVRADVAESAAVDALTLGRDRPWSGLKILEIGSGFAAPMIARLFAEQGAHVIHIESSKRPDFLRVYSYQRGADAPLELSRVFAALNADKRGMTLNLKDPRGVAIARALVRWADAVVENFAPGVLEEWGLDPMALLREDPGLVVARSCLLGQTGPQRTYPGFGGQGSALSGYNWLTGWPDRAPLSPYGAMTDTIGARFGAAALAAALLYRRATGRGAILDISQVEAAIFTLAPYLQAWKRGGVAAGRMGDRSEHAVPHGVFPCRGEERWIALAVWTEEDWRALARLASLDRWAGLDRARRRAVEDEIEHAVARWTACQERDALAERLQANGIEAYPVNDFGDLHADPQLVSRGHFVRVPHPRLPDLLTERCGFRLEGRDAGFTRGGPTMGEHNREVLHELLGHDDDAVARLERDGVCV